MLEHLIKFINFRDFLQKKRKMYCDFDFNAQTVKNHKNQKFYFGENLF